MALCVLASPAEDEGIVSFDEAEASFDPREPLELLKKIKKLKKLKKILG